MQFVPNARNFMARLALSGNALKNHSNHKKVHQNGYKTEKPIASKQPIGLCNKPYTLLRTAGYFQTRIFHPLCNQHNQTIEMIRGKLNFELKHTFVFTSPIANTNVLQRKLFFRTGFQPSKLNRHYLTSRFSFFSADSSLAAVLPTR